jgi:hypothetical protein
MNPLWARGLALVVLAGACQGEEADTNGGWTTINCVRANVEQQCWEGGSYEFPDPPWGSFELDCTADVYSTAIAPDGTCYQFGSYCDNRADWLRILSESGYSEGPCPNMENAGTGDDAVLCPPDSE